MVGRTQRAQGKPVLKISRASKSGESNTYHLRIDRKRESLASGDSKKPTRPIIASTIFGMAEISSLTIFLPKTRVFPAFLIPLGVKRL